ncbi:hypothetical protein [Inhella gelatinilytica]|uniref:Uncharacterized protein n=1 Tax=Inhella gelatinilytica TaxID=2795030 RepID=A0A931IXI0_9BURK|nr:hypothetical protein [Inhella gelatinilytica]MBH9553989.1 hypothetical protein [Inhella gelatinilytica]
MPVELLPKEGAGRRSLYYPCAGLDWLAVTEVLGQSFDVLKFCDLHYSFASLPAVLPNGWRYEADSWSLDGSAHGAVSALAVNGRFVRDVETATARFKLRNESMGKSVEIWLRRGFGQYGLHEIKDGTLDLFLHRGDSSGEGGSNVWFFSNWRARHQPLSRLFDVVKEKLRYPAVIGTDGSNCEFREVRLAAGVIGRAEFACQGLHWRLIGFLPGGPSLTALWQVEPA